MSGETILIVDDLPLNLKIASAVLRIEGFQVRTATDGVEALRSLEECRPDLILSDIQMPNMDGLELARTVKSDEALRRIPLIALTAFSHKTDMADALAAGFDGYMTKPLDTRHLGGSLRQFLSPHSEAGPD
jgi:two-component system cell cycle response regulator DivK